MRVIPAETAKTMTPDEIKAVLKPLRLREAVQLGPLRVIRCNRWEFSVNDPNDRGHSRWGRLNEITEDIVHFWTYGVMPRSTPGRPW